MAQIIDGIQIEVKASLTVDERTFKMCSSLISFYAKEKGFEGMLFEFNDNYCEGYLCEEIKNMTEFRDVLDKGYLRLTEVERRCDYGKIN